ncbi:MAG: hypothetical protein NW208_17105 [Bryobacter sp.]|nr:hypothetical protein [Bryobacter sp.]
MHRYSRPAFYLFLFLLSAIVYFYFPVGLFAQPWAPLPDQLTFDAFKQQLASLRALVDLAHSDLARTQQLLLFLAGLGTIYALAQGILSFKSLEALTTRAQTDLADHKTDLENRRERLDKEFATLKSDLQADFQKLRQQIESQMPGIEGLSDRLNRALQQFGELQRQVGIHRKTFSRVEPDIRQRVERLETYFPLLETFRAQESGELASVCLLFSVFHMAKAHHARQAEAALPLPHLQPLSQDEMALSRYYLDRALKLCPHDHRLLNEKAHRLMNDSSDGFLLGHPSPVSDRLAEARALVAESLRKKRLQKRALIMQAYLLDEESPARTEEAVNHLREALTTQDWEGIGDGHPFQNAVPHYNLACALTKLASHLGSPISPENEQKQLALLKEAMEHLESRTSFDEAGVLAILNTDLAPNGELYLLAQQPQFTQRVLEVRSKLERKRIASEWNA